MNLLTSREPVDNRSAGCGRPVDDLWTNLWTNLLSNLPTGTQQVPSSTPLPGIPADLLTSLPKGRSDNRCQGGTEPADTTTQQLQQFHSLHSLHRTATQPTHERNTQLTSKLSVVVGGQYGSEGKGAIAGHLTKPQARTVVCVRIGGPNAGHTVLGNGPDGPRHPWRLRTIPVAAVTNPDATLVIAAGSEIDLDVLNHEAQSLEDHGHQVWDRLYIDPQATILTPEHIQTETNLDIHTRIGSTGKGIGAARADRIMRTAPIWADHQREHHNVPIDTAEYLLDALGEDAHVVIEGTQGYGLGLHAGYYPQCTSNDARAIDFLAMAGINPWAEEVGVFRVYVVARVNPIRVAGNSGHLEGETTWQELGLEPELTTVTRKIRRVGQWDPQLVADAVRHNGGGPKSLTVQVCLTMLDHAVPEAAHYTGPLEGLPAKAREWVQRVQDETGAPVAMVGTGPDTIAGSWA